MRYRKCEWCGTEYDMNERYCPYCGTETPNWKKNPNLCRCPDCHTLISKNAKSCPHCGSKLYIKEETSTAGKVFITIVALALIVMGIVIAYGGCQAPLCSGTITLTPMK